jgi:hypothetical protein
MTYIDHFVRLRTACCQGAALTIIALAAVLLGNPLAAGATAGIIQNVLGEARVSQRSGLERPAQKGVQLYEGDTVTTGARSNMQIRMIDEAMIWLSPNSSLKIDEYSYARQGGGRDQAALRLTIGGLRTVTGQIGSIRRDDYALRTPNSVIGIRGTDFQVLFIGATRRSSEPNAAAGTYNRVYVGATALSANGVTVTIPQGQAGFAALDPGAPPQLLQNVPAFMNAPPPAATPSPGSAPSPAAGAPRQLLVTLRYGNPGDAAGSTISSRSAASDNEEQSVRVLDGAKAILTLSQSNPSATRQRSGAQSISVVEFLPRLSGNTVTVQIQAQRASRGSSGASLSENVATTLSTRLAEWTEVTGRGPWGGSETAETTSSFGTQRDIRRIFLKVDDMTR